MSALSDPEDNFPVSSIPPEPVETFRERDTIPAPENDIAAAVVEALRPAFLALEQRIVGNTEAINELVVLRKQDLLRMDSLDIGVGAALRQGEAIANDVATLKDVVTHSVNGVFAIAADLQDLRASVLNQADHDGEKRRELEQSVEELQERHIVTG